ncbi:hypothetical protein HPB48_022022 [Haemaphysalis longicornis]|uniref:Uncharacterized protein n=1 Tax=Haemaphysalis longicornis TaxID=44386 RepID=A0A9J6G223_HAELO|nr:hypothetical protein HPB48_022022 [Haemaphysalis longicornis]
MGAHSLVTVVNNRRVPVRIVNTTLHEIKIPKNKLIGTLIPSVIAEEPYDEVVWRRIERADMHDLFNLLQIPEPQNSKIRDLIHDFGVAFSTCRTDIGHCEAIKHRISTGRASPLP